MPRFDFIQPGESLAVNGRESDKGAAIHWPTVQGRQVWECAFIFKDGTPADHPWPGVPHRARNIPEFPRGLGRQAGVTLQPHQFFQAGQGVPEKKTGSLKGAEQVGHHGEAGVFGPGEKQGGPTRPIHPPLDLGHLQMGIQREINAAQHPMAFEIRHAFGQVQVSHRGFRAKARPA